MHRLSILCGGERVDDGNAEMTASAHYSPDLVHR